MQNRASLEFSVIVPAPTINPPPAVLEDLKAISENRSVEVLIATGSNPSSQRNLAAAKARGDWLVFVDSDCRLDAVYFEKLVEHSERGLGIVGGPALLLGGPGHLEVLFQSLLSHRFLTGASSARYVSSGNLRKCDDAELILCNLAVRRDLFLESSGFDERLYPNEENEWLTRLRARGVASWHDPKLITKRPQRKTWSAYVRMLIRYGRGRSRQFMVSGIWDATRQGPTLLVLGLLMCFAYKPSLAIRIALAMWLSLSTACKVLSSPGTRRLPTMAALIGPTVPLLYTVGQVIELLHPTSPPPAGAIRVFRWEPKSGDTIPVD